MAAAAADPRGSRSVPDVHLARASWFHLCWVPVNPLRPVVSSNSPPRLPPESPENPMVNLMLPAALGPAPAPSFTKDFYDCPRLALFFRPDWNQNCS